MSEENMEKQEGKCNCGCECKCLMMSEDFRKFLIVLIGTFLGAFFALSTFYALNKPIVSAASCPMRHGYGHFEHKMDKHIKHHFDDDMFEDDYDRPVRKDVRKK